MLRSSGVRGQAARRERSDRARQRTAFDGSTGGLGSAAALACGCGVPTACRSPGVREKVLVRDRHEPRPKSAQPGASVKQRVTLRVGRRGDLVAVQLVIARAKHMASEEDEASVVRIADDASGAGGFVGGGVESAELHGDVGAAQARCHAGDGEVRGSLRVRGWGVLQGRDGAGVGARGWRVRWHLCPPRPARQPTRGCSR